MASTSAGTASLSVADDRAAPSGYRPMKYPRASPMPLPLLVPFALLLATACGSGGSPVDVPAEKWNLVWSDEFDRDGLPSAAKWSYDTGGHGWGNNELQFYTEARAENARVEGGHLIVEARKEPYQGKGYTSARLITKSKGDWLYGRVEVRAKLPSGRGTWPAIWMLPTRWTDGNGGWPDNGEIDIMEHVGYDPDVVHATVHTGAYNHSIGTQKGKNTRVPTARTDFNVYAIEWEPNQIRGYVNDVLYFTFDNERAANPAANYKQWPFDKPFHLLLNVAVGGNWGGAQGVDESIWPQRMTVDYVRVYEAQ